MKEFRNVIKNYYYGKSIGCKLRIRIYNKYKCNSSKGTIKPKF